MGARHGRAGQTEEIVGTYPSPTLLMNGTEATGCPVQPELACCLDLPTEEQIVTSLTYADNPNAAMPRDIDFYLNAQRGGIPQWPNRFAVMSWTEWLTFDPIAIARAVSVPTLMVHSQDAACPQGAHRFWEQLTCPKEAHWITGNQCDFHDGEAKSPQRLRPVSGLDRPACLISRRVGNEDAACGSWCTLRTLRHVPRSER